MWKLSRGQCPADNTILDVGTRPGEQGGEGWGDALDSRGTQPAGLGSGIHLTLDALATVRLYPSTPSTLRP